LGPTTPIPAGYCSTSSSAVVPFHSIATMCDPQSSGMVEDTIPSTAAAGTVVVYARLFNGDKVRISTSPSVLSGGGGSLEDLSTMV